MVKLQGLIHHHSLCNTENSLCQFLLRDYKFRAIFNTIELVIVQIANFSDRQCKGNLYLHVYKGCSLH
ncbi:hypothetical protein BT93_K1160 [Corymbia citriodora subsp. variegata]|nr:hypothetical protein BT93_K1160 [Corymbia citriodora subsp. variegata]